MVTLCRYSSKGFPLVEGDSAFHMTQTAQTTSVVQDANAYYDELLKAAGVTAEQYQQMQADLIAAKNAFGERSQCPYLRPQFVSADQWAHVQKTAALVNSAMVKAGKLILADESLRELLCLTDGEKTLIEPDPGYDWLSPHCRYDSFLTDDSFAFVELNGESPAGPAYTTVLANIWLEHPLTKPVMDQFQTRFKLETFDVRVPLLHMLTSLYAEWRANGHTDRPEKPVIGIIDYEGLSTQPEFELCQEYFTEQGYQTLIADPRKLRYENGRLLSPDGVAIDVVYRRVLTNEFLDHFADVQAMWNAYKDGAVCVVNPFRSKLLHKKSIFAIITDERVMPHFTAEEQEAIKSAVPWTRLVREGKTLRFDGTEIDLLPWMRENQQNLVVKPNDEYGGKGVYIGWAMSDSEWEAAIAEAQESPFVVQWKVKAPKVAFPVWGVAENEVVWEPQTIDLDPFVFFGKAHGFLTRLSTNDLCNVTAGGGIVPTFVVARQ
ncbi:Glutathionylspermidine synthase [compost metagenome]